MRILCYHDLGARMGLGISRVRPEALARQIDFLRDCGWRFAPLAEFEPSGKRVLAVTFDDAYELQLQHAIEILGARAIPATAFVVSGYVGKGAGWDYAGARRKHADWGLLREWVNAGMSVGSHGVSHGDLRRMSTERLTRELEGSRKLLSDRLGVNVTSIAYPFGRCNESVVTAASQAGYTLGVGTQPSGGIDPVMHAPRIVVTRTDTELSVAERLEPSIWGAFERGKQRLVSFWAGGTPMFQRLRGAIQ